jgi:hypothetical protein
VSAPVEKAKYKIEWTLPAPVRIKSTGETGKLAMIAYGAIVTEQGDGEILWVRLDSTGAIVKVYSTDAERIEQ